MQNGRRARQRLSDQPQKGRDLVESVVLVPKGAEGGWCHGTTGQGGGQKFENLRAGGSGPRVGSGHQHGCSVLGGPEPVSGTLLAEEEK